MAARTYTYDPSYTTSSTLAGGGRGAAAGIGLGSTVGGALGAAGIGASGTAVGIAGGAAIGSVVPIVGTAIGAGIGLLAGALMARSKARQGQREEQDTKKLMKKQAELQKVQSYPMDPNLMGSMSVPNTTGYTSWQNQVYGK